MKFPPGLERNWKPIECVNCGGSGQVSSYTFGGTDFLGAEECDNCAGSGKEWVHKSGAIAAYPGGPFTGHMDKNFKWEKAQCKI